MAEAIRASAERLGVNPVDLATAISYETKGTFDPLIKGPTTKWGQHIGLIQPGEVQRRQYGIDPSAPLPDQFAGIERYLTAAGVKKGHGLLDIYSAINAGGVGRYNRSDAAAGGAPGTVADKVAGMAPHRVRAELLLNGKLPPGFGIAREASPKQVAGAAPLSIAPAGPADQEGDNFGALLEAAKRFAASTQEDKGLPPALPPLQVLADAMPVFDRRRLRG